jgi:catechol 2,3-dioxygenase-like lactoylglutathione lyase family enzyme
MKSAPKDRGKKKNRSRRTKRRFNVLFVAGFGPIVRGLPESHKFYRDALGLAFEQQGDYLHTDKLKGVKHFALWPLAQAARSCFGSDTWPSGVSVPQAWMEFDVDHIEEATKHLEQKGYRLLAKAKQEPWGQTVSRLLSPEGLLVAVTVTPGMRE